jgi:hypothetical protein
MRAVSRYIDFRSVYALLAGGAGSALGWQGLAAESGLPGEYRSTVRKLGLAAQTEVEH